MVQHVKVSAPIHFGIGINPTCGGINSANRYFCAALEISEFHWFHLRFKLHFAYFTTALRAWYRFQ